MSNEQFYNIFRNLKDQAFKAADKVDEHFDSLAGTIRDQWTNSSWVPASVKPSPPPPPPSTSLSRAAGNDGLVDWFVSHRVITAGLAAVGAGSVFWLVKGRRIGERRRKKAARSLNGARKEVVVVHGSGHEALVRSVVHDLDKRGFIVYVVVSTPEDEAAVISDADASHTKMEKSGITPLNLDILDPASAQSAVDKFSQSLRAPQTAFPGALPHHLRLTSVIIIPDAHYPTGPIESIPIEHWSYTFNLKLVQTLAIAQLFLPLLADYKARLLFITPSIPHSLNLPFHAPEVAAISALGGVIKSLRREVRPSGVKVIWIRTGNFEFNSGADKEKVSKDKQLVASTARADVLSWPANVRAAYGRNYVSSSQSNPVTKPNVRGTSPKSLHWAVFDSITRRHIKEVHRVGNGSVCYDVIGRYAPEGLVCWMMGISRAPLESGRTASGPGKGSPGGSSSSLEGSAEWEKVDK